MRLNKFQREQWQTIMVHAKQIIFQAIIVKGGKVSHFSRDDINRTALTFLIERAKQELKRKPK